MRLTLTTCLATVLLAISPVPAVADLESCFHRPPEDWSACLEAVDGSAVSLEQLRGLNTLVAEDPETAFSYLQRLESAIRRADPGRFEGSERHAVLLDRQAEAQRRQGNAERAAELTLAALEAHSGTRSLAWWSSVDGKRLWSAALDASGERRERAARALLELDRKPEARGVLAGALRLGAGGEAETLWAESGGGPVEGFDPDPEPLLAAPWYPRLPQVLVPLVEGEPFSLVAARGNVLILDFWASWCEPCLKSLPALGRLYESEKERGLQVILVNMGEAPERALRFARGLDLQMPVGIYDEALEDAFDAETLPTMIVADREGRVRARWDGYGEQVASQAATLARRLMGPEADESGESLGWILRGGDRLRLDWVREVKGAVDGLAIVRPQGPAAPAALVALVGRQVLRYDWRGVLADSSDRPRGAGLLRGGDLDGAGRDLLFSFRRGGRRIALLDLEQGKHEEFESPAPLLDLAVVPPGAAGQGSVFVATVSGLHRIAESRESTAVEGISEPTGLAAVELAGGWRLAAIGRDGIVCILDPADAESIRCSAGHQGSRVVAGPAGSGIGAVPGGTAAVAGRILGGEQGEIAVITSSSQLVILDVVTGQERVRARLPGLQALAAGDLDGDGDDELALAVEGHVLVLTAEALSDAAVEPDVGNDHE